MKAFLTSFRHSSSDLLASALGHTLWKRKYQERVLRRDEDTKKIALDVFGLPVKAGLAARLTEYKFQGSFVVNLAGLEEGPTRPFRKSPRFEHKGKPHGAAGRGRYPRKKSFKR